MRRIKSIISIALLLCAVVGFAQTEMPAFPGAEGGGMFATGGRGGNVYFVNTLDDTSTGNLATREGTLRWCLAQQGPRTIVFKVAGIIRLNSVLTIKDNTTIAGQTAPGDGICLANHTTQLKGNNIIIRYVRFRMGDLNSAAEDAFWGKGYANIIIDHCSMSWSVDECASFYQNSNFTLQWCILAESLRNSVHPKGAHGYGGIWGGMTATFHHNLLAHHDSRNPRMCGSRYSNRPDLELVDFRNNVIYNWGSNSGYAGEGGSYNFVNNYYKPGPGSSNTTRIFQPNADDGSNQQAKGVWGSFYVAGNYMDGSTAVTENNWAGIHPNPSTKSIAELKSDVEFTVPFVTTQSADSAYLMVLADAGASFNRDSTDARIVNEVANGLAPARGSKGTTRAGLIDSQSDVGGWEQYTFRDYQVPADSDRDGMADDWELTFGLSPADSSDHNLIDTTGYTMLEKYLNTMAFIPDTTVVEPIDTMVVEPIDTTVIVPIDTTVVEPGDTTVNVSDFEDVRKQQLEVYPNPASENICVKFNLSKSENVKIELLSVIGKRIKILADRSCLGGFNELNFDVSGLNKGLYFCRAITSTGNSRMVKFMVQ